MKASDVVALRRRRKVLDKQKGIEMQITITVDTQGQIQVTSNAMNNLVGMLGLLEMAKQILFKNIEEQAKATEGNIVPATPRDLNRIINPNG